MIERLLPIAATLLARTLRLRWSGDTLPDRAVIMFWHGKMFAGWYAVRGRKPVALVSRSKDGQLLSAVLRSWKYKLALGSSGKKGMEALSEAMEVIRNGEAKTLVITPDGPRGPQHQLKRGAFIAAAELGLPIYMLSIRYHSPIQFVKSWDKFELPLPFSAVSITAQKLEDVKLPTGDPEEQRAWLTAISKKYLD